MKNPIELVAGSFDDKRRWRSYRNRVRTLSAHYREAVEALERYLLYFGSSKSAVFLTMLDDLVVLFEQAEADALGIRAIVGDDPVDFAETFLANYADGGWIERERTRLADAVERAAGGR